MRPPQDVRVRVRDGCDLKTWPRAAAAAAAAAGRSVGGGADDMIGQAFNHPTEPRDRSNHGRTVATAALALGGKFKPRAQYIR